VTGRLLVRGVHQAAGLSVGSLFGWAVDWVFVRLAGWLAGWLVDVID
jgi:hypothetical protein